MFENVNYYKEISKNGLIENAKASLFNKFGFMPQHHKRINSYKINNNTFLLSKSSINNSKHSQNNEKRKINHLEKKIKKKNYKVIKISKSSNQLINNVNEINNKKKISRNYKEIISSNITNNTNSHLYSSFFNKKPKMFKTLKNNYKFSYSITNDQNKKEIIHNSNKSKVKNKKIIFKKKNNSNEFVLNIKPIIKKKDNLIHNQLWSKLITNIDIKQNDKINKLKTNYLNKSNINNNNNTNTKINLNTKNTNIVDVPKENNINYTEYTNNFTNSNLTTNNINININNNNNSTLEKKFSKNYLPNLSLNDITNYKPPEKDNSIMSNNEENNKKLKESQKQKNKNSNKFENYVNSKSKSLKEKNTIKKENKLHKINSSSMFEDSNMDNTLNKKKEIKYCDSDTYKTSNDNNNNEKENKKQNNNNNNDKKSEDDNVSFIGDNNSYHRVIKKSLEKDSNEKREKNHNIESEQTENNIKNFYKNSKNYNIFNIFNNSTYQTDNIKIYKLLSRNYSYNASSRDIREESARKIKHENKKINYSFISEIEKINKNIINLNKKKFLNFQDNIIFKILSFGLDIYLPLINSDKHIKNKINKSLNKTFENVINDFKFKYKDYLKVIHYKFEQNKIKSFYRNNEYILDLILTCKIISKSIEKSIEISCNFLFNNKKYDYLWKLDLQKKTKINNWVTTEINVMKNYHKTISYTSQVSSFSYGDEIQFDINILNINNSLEPSSFEWCQPIISSVKPGIYENTKYISKISYDPLRACEVEKQILLWHDILGKEQMIIFEEVKKIYKEFFQIKKIYYDKSKFFFYKIIMVPYKLGILSRNKYCSFDINIIDLDSPIRNEIQCIYFMNTNNFTNRMDIRLGNTLTLYIIDMNSSN